MIDPRGTLIFLCLLGLGFSLASNVYSQREPEPTYEPLYACPRPQEPGDGGLPDAGLPDAGSGRCHWECTCGGWEVGKPIPDNKFRTCRGVCDDETPKCKLKPIGRDPALQNMLRCFYEGSPSATGIGEAAGFIRKHEDTCVYDVADRVESKVNHAAQICTGAADIVAEVHTHPTWSVDDRNRVTNIGPEPSRPTDKDPRGDTLSAAHCKIPFYVLTSRFVWVAYPDGTTQDVTGRFPGWANSKCGK